MAAVLGIRPLIEVAEGAGQVLLVLKVLVLLEAMARLLVLVEVA
jgi:hypothetical protein